MTDQIFIDKNKTKTFSKGEMVMMHSCLEANLSEYKGKVWICLTDSFMSRGQQDVIFLEDFSGYFCTEFLKKI